VAAALEEWWDARAVVDIRESQLAEWGGRSSVWAAYRLAVGDTDYYLSDVGVLAAGEMAGVDMTLCRERQMEAEKEEELHVMGRSGGVGVPIGGAIVLRGRGGWLRAPTLSGCGGPARRPPLRWPGALWGSARRGRLR